MYIVSDGSATFVVDPASDAKKIAAALGGRKLDAIVLTHRHSDHVAAAAELRSLTGATVIASAIDADMICGDKPVPRDDQKFPACPVDQRVNHGDVVKIGNMPWKVISTPGHTEGSMCLFLDSSLTERLDAKPVLIAGDTLFFGSIGRTDFSGGSMSAMRKSLKRLAVLPDDTVVLPGHGNLATARPGVAADSRRRRAFFRSGAVVCRCRRYVVAGRLPRVPGVSLCDCMRKARVSGPFAILWVCAACAYTFFSIMVFMTSAASSHASQQASMLSNRFVHTCTRMGLS